MGGMIVPMIGMAASVGGTIMSSNAQRMAGQEQSLSAQWDQRQNEVAAQQNRTAAAETEARRREELTSSLETLQAIRAGRNTGAYSQTGQAILESSTARSEKDIAINRNNYLTRADQNAVAASLSARKAQSSLIAGELAAGTTLFTGASKIANIYANNKSSLAN